MGGVRKGRGCGWCEKGEGVVDGVRVRRGCGWCESGEGLWVV